MPRVNCATITDSAGQVSAMYRKDLSGVAAIRLDWGEAHGRAAKRPNIHLSYAVVIYVPQMVAVSRGGSRLAWVSTACN